MPFSPSSLSTPSGGLAHSNAPLQGPLPATLQRVHRVECKARIAQRRHNVLSYVKHLCVHFWIQLFSNYLLVGNLSSDCLDCKV